jgi:hypothetical protein
MGCSGSPGLVNVDAVPNHPGLTPFDSRRAALELIATSHLTDVHDLETVPGGLVSPGGG